MKTEIKLMVVDDHPFIIDGIKSQLQEVNHIHVIGEAGNGLEAISMLKLLTPDILLMDIEMPVMNAFDAIPVIRSSHPEIKIIILTSYDEKSLIQKVFDLGVQGYLLKNTRKEQLIESLEKVAKGETVMSGEVVLSKSVTSPANKFTVQSQVLENPLSERETQILKMIASGLTNKEIAEKLFISANTVDTHRMHIMKKLEVHNVSGLIKYAIKSGLI